MDLLGIIKLIKSGEGEKNEFKRRIADISKTFP